MEERLAMAEWYKEYLAHLRLYFGILWTASLTAFYLGVQGRGNIFFWLCLGFIILSLNTGSAINRNMNNLWKELIGEEGTG